MKCLHDERTVRIQKRRCGTKQTFDRFLAEQREITNDNVNGNGEFAGSDLLVRYRTKVPSASLLGRFYQVGYDVHTNDADAMCGQFAGKPSLAATDIED